MIETKANRRTVFLLIAAVLSIATAASVGLTQRRIPSRGTVYVEVLDVEAYWDAECTAAVTEIDWGVLEPSDVTNVTIYMKNAGNAAVVLSMVAENWVPTEASSFITVTWDAEGVTLDVDEIMAVKISMNVSSEISGISDFSLDIVISGGVP